MHDCAFLDCASLVSKIKRFLPDKSVNATNAQLI